MTTPTSTTPTTPPRGPNVWVVHRGGRFSIREEGNPAYLIGAMTRKLAIPIARLVARAYGSQALLEPAPGRRGR